MWKWTINKENKNKIMLSGCHELKIILQICTNLTQRWLSAWLFLLAQLRSITWYIWAGKFIHFTNPRWINLRVPVTTTSVLLSNNWCEKPRVNVCSCVKVITETLLSCEFIVPLKEKNAATVHHFQLLNFFYIFFHILCKINFISLLKQWHVSLDS